MALSSVGTVVAAITFFMARRKERQVPEIQVRIEDSDGSEHILVLHDPLDQERLTEFLRGLEHVNVKPSQGLGGDLTSA